MAKHVGGDLGKSGSLTLMSILRLDGDPVWGKWMILCCREKPLASYAPPVPQTDSGDQVENTKAIERIVVKELGKMPP